MHFNLMGETFPTVVNAPGQSYMIHLQGCNLGCQQCFNPESWSFKTKNLVNVEELADKIISHNPDSLTISGGEPFLQIGPLLYFLKYLHKDNPSNCPFPQGILIYSGFYEEELIKMPEYKQILYYVDVIVSGRFDFNKRIYNSLLSSSNQKFIWGDRGLIKEQDLENQNYEIIIEEEGLKLTGFPSDWNKEIIKDLKSKGIEFRN
jgi:anaerobic ribonucleoside-triphosphate reductase activating protein